jgi:porin-like protein
MTLMKSILLGSAAALVAVAAAPAQAADLPTRKAAPAEYVKICNVGGMAGFIIPGSDTCLKFSGYIVGQFTAGNIQTGYGGTYSTSSPVYYTNDVLHTGNPTPIVPGAMLSVPSVNNTRPDIGFDTRLNFSADVRQDTAYGVLRGYFDAQWDIANGFDALQGPAGNNYGYINHAYLQWAGLTIGKANSFFSFYGGGEAWANLFSPDRNGYNQPMLFAYTATFGGGFSATISAESAFSVGPSGGGTNFSQLADYTYFGERAPDIVAALRVDQGWGSAQISGVAHQVDVTETVDGLGANQTTWGWAINAGAKFNLPSFGPGDYIQVQGTWSQNAMWYSGLPDGLWGEMGQANGNGIAMPGADTFYYVNPAGVGVWATPTAWSISASAEHHFNPVFSIDPEFAYGELNWGNTSGSLASNSTSWIVGLVGHWDPVPHMDFELEILYNDTHQSTPGLYTPAANGGVAFPSDSSGFAGRFQVTRDF